MLQIKNTLGGGKPEGLYVWKKNKYNPPVTISNPSITITCPSTYGNKLNIISADIDIKTLWEDLWSTSSNKDLSRILTDAYGNISEWKSSSGISIGLASSMTSKIGFVQKNGTDGISYLYKDTSIPTYCVFVMVASSNFSVYAGTYTFNGEYKISDSSVEFIDYVVSDEETAYPDGGEKGGYWYERVGNAKVTTGTVTPSVSGWLRVEHGLGKTPDFIIVQYNTIETSYLGYAVHDKKLTNRVQIGTHGSSSNAVKVMYRNSTEYDKSTDNACCNDTFFSFPRLSTSYYWRTSGEYNWICGCYE